MGFSILKKNLKIPKDVLFYRWTQIMKYGFFWLFSLGPPVLGLAPFDHLFTADLQHLSTVKRVSEWMICGLILRCSHGAKHLFERLDLTDEPLLPLQIRKLKLQLEEERQKGSRSDGGTAGDLAELQNGSDLQLIEMQSEAGPAHSPGWGASGLLGPVVPKISPEVDQKSGPSQSRTEEPASSCCPGWCSPLLGDMISRTSCS